MSDLRVIIAGGGRTGFMTAELLDDRGHEPIIIERSAERCEELGDEYVATVIQGDASSPGVLRQAAPERADAIAALTPDTATNLAVCMTAEKLSPDIHSVMRIEADEDLEYAEFVDDLVYPERAAARVATSAITGAEVRTLEDITGELNVMEVTIAEDAPAANRPLTDVRFPDGCLVISSETGDAVARADTVLEAGRRYLVAVEPDVVGEVMNLLRG